VTSFDIASCVQGLPLYDVHEHHMPETLHDRDVGLLKLLKQSYASAAVPHAALESSA
jgi:hypothetical protein